MSADDQESNLHLNHKSLLREGRKIFTAVTGYVSDPAWYRFRSAIVSQGLVSRNLTEEEIISAIGKAARIRKELPGAGIPFDSVLKFYLRQEELVKQIGSRTLKGQELLDLIRKEGIKLPNSTRSNWFEKIGGYSKRRSYLPQEIQHILFLASVYKSRKERNKTQQ